MNPVAFVKHSVTLGAASAGAAAALAAAEKLGIRISIAIVDEAGDLKFFARTDSAKLITLDFAIKKAVTAVATQRPTREYFQYLQRDPQMTVIATNSDFLVLGGGLPIIVDGNVVGAIGVSGGSYDQDVECAQAGMDALLTH